MVNKKEKIEMLKIENELLRNKVAQLTEDNKELNKINTERNDEIASLKSTLRKYEILNDGTPEDCKRGDWCKACEFAKPINVSDGLYGCIGIRTVYFCGKGEACSNFVQKEI